MLLPCLLGSYAYRSASALGIELIAFGGGSNRLAGSWRGDCSERPAALLPADSSSTSVRLGAPTQTVEPATCTDFFDPLITMNSCNTVTR